MKKYKILIVEDDRQLAELMKLNFPQEQFTARICTDSRQAIADAESDLPSLIILDVIMPHMDGWDVLAKIRATHATAAVPVIMCTGRDSVNDVEKSFKMGAQAFIMKPIVFSNLLKKVAAILNIEQLLND